MKKSEFDIAFGCIIIGVIVIGAPLLWALSGPLLAFFVYRDGWEETGIWKRIFGILASLSVIGTLVYFFFDPAQAYGPLEIFSSQVANIIALLIHIASLGIIYFEAKEQLG